MFQFKNTGLGIKEPQASSALPNTYGKVRTFKEDSENFEKKGATEEYNPQEEGALPQEIAEKSLGNTPPARQETPQTIPAPPSRENTPNNPFQSVPTPPPIASPDSGLPDFKSSPSESFFSQTPPPEENALPEYEAVQPLPQKSRNRFVLPLAIVLIVSAVGAGSYYWFYIRNAPVSTISNSVGQTAPASSPDAQNKNLRRLIVDTSQNPTEIRDAVQKFASGFVASASENDLAEVKLLRKDNQPIGKKDFFSGFGMTVPDAVLMKLSEDYSLFARKENGATKMGLAFKTVTSSGLADEMKNWESSITSDLNSLYLEQTPTAAAASFNSSQYKNADIRYFNFSSPAGTSLDYSVISNFLIIGTSKDSTRAVLDYMAAK